MTLKELLAALKRCREEMETALGKVNGAKSDEEKARHHAVFEAKQEEFADLKGKIDQAKQLASVQSAIDEVAALDAPDVEGKSLNPKPPAKTKQSGVEVINDPWKDAIECKSFFFEYIRDGGVHLEDRARDAIAVPKHRQLDQDAVYLPKDMVYQILGGRLSDMEMGGKLLSKTMLTTQTTGGSTDSGLGNAIAEDFRPEMLRMPVAMPNLFDYCRIERAVNGTAVFPIGDATQGNFFGVAFTWKATEGADKEETEPAILQFTVSTNELSGWTQCSLRALRRPAISLEAFLTGLFRDACKYEWSRVVWRGAGAASNQPEGVVINSSVTTVARQTANQVDWTDLTNLEFAISMGNRYNARFVCDDTVEKYLKQTLDTLERPVYTADVGSNMRNLLAGYPYTPHEHEPALGTEGDIAFGNFNNYAFAIEEDIAIARSEHAEFKKGLVVFRLICWVGGKVIHPSAFAILSDAAT